MSIETMLIVAGVAFALGVPIFVSYRSPKEGQDNAHTTFGKDIQRRR